jgi:hypothetical protein
MVQMADSSAGRGSENMTLEEAIGQLTPFRKKVPGDALEFLRKHWSEAAPLLLAEMDRVLDDPWGEESALLFYALYLCAEMRCEDAFERYVKFCRMPDALVDYLLGDARLESMNKWLAQTCAGRLDELKSLVEDSFVDEYSRSSALEALQFWAVDHPEFRAEYEMYCVQLLGEKLELEASFIWNQTVSVTRNMGIKVAWPLIEFAYATGVVDTLFSSPEAVKKQLEQGEVSELRNELEPTEVEVGRFSRNWNGLEGTPPDHYELLETPRKSWREKRVSAGKEPGRNESCPCGSGRKYKKCCLHLGLTIQEAGSSEGFMPKNEADEWMAAGYFYRKKSSSYQAMLCWFNALEKGVPLIPGQCLNPDDDEIDLLFDGCAHFSDWLQDLISLVSDYASKDMRFMPRGLDLMDAILARFPEMDLDFSEEVIKAKFKTLIYMGRLDRVLMELLELQRRDEHWLGVEAELWSWNAGEYNLIPDWERAKELFLQARLASSGSDAQHLDECIKDIDQIAQETKEHEEERKKRVKIALESLA